MSEIKFTVENAVLYKRVIFTIQPTYCIWLLTVSSSRMHEVKFTWLTSVVGMALLVVNYAILATG